MIKYYSKLIFYYESLCVALLAQFFPINNGVDFIFIDKFEEFADIFVFYYSVLKHSTLEIYCSLTVNSNIFKFPQSGLQNI